MTGKLMVFGMLVAGGVGSLHADEPVSVRKGEPVVESPVLLGGKKGVKAAEPWLGIDVSKPDAVVHAHLKGVPKGVGFVVTSVSPGSPAEVAGLGEYDFVWKMGDQLLVNRSQFWTLLNLREVGEEVTLTIQRGGEDREVKLVVGSRPEDEKGRERADVGVMTPRIPGLPTQVHDLLRRVAELSDEEGTVRIWRKGDGYAWAQFDEFDLEIGSGAVSGTAEEAFPPEMDKTLKRKLQALIRGYEQAEQNRKGRVGGPRPRRLPSGG